MFDAVEYAQAGICTIAGNQDHFNTLVILLTGIQGQQLLDQLKGFTGFKIVIFATDLVLSISRQAF